MVNNFMHGEQHLQFNLAVINQCAKGVVNYCLAEPALTPMFSPLTRQFEHVDTSSNDQRKTESFSLLVQLPALVIGL